MRTWNLLCAVFVFVDLTDGSQTPVDGSSFLVPKVLLEKVLYFARYIRLRHFLTATNVSFLRHKSNVTMFVWEQLQIILLVGVRHQCCMAMVSCMIIYWCCDTCIQSCQMFLHVSDSFLRYARVLSL